jgi:putative acetyltransferase
MIVRRARTDPAVGDADTIRGVHLAAFDPGDGTSAVEAALTDALVADEGFLSALSLVAERDGAVIGHVICTRATIGDGVPVLGLGPLGVLPAHQAHGVGAALMHAVLGAADALDEPVVVLLGNPAYYGRFGFGTAADLGIEAPDPRWGVHFQARPLTAFDPAVHRGPFRYAAPFDAL